MGGDLRILMGNEAIGRALVENGCTLAAAYPGTPSSEILESVVAFARETGAAVHAEWSVNEKVAYEVALAHSYTGKRSAVAMKQVGLNVAADPFVRSAYLGVKGGLVLVSADDPGPHSSQTEQDSRALARFARVPVLDPCSPREAGEMVGTAFELSERHEVPVMLRPTTRVCHARQDVACGRPVDLRRRADFRKDPSRWGATPRFLAELHRRLNERLETIAAEDACEPVRETAGAGRVCLVASGVVAAHALDVMEQLSLEGELDLFRVLMPFPLNRAFIRRLRADYDRVLVLEETYPVIEEQLCHPGVSGKTTGAVPREGELDPDRVAEALERFLGRRPSRPGKEAPPGLRPTLCAGCPHRPAFWAIRKAFPRGIYPGDIGCYTLGMNLGAVDTVHCMGAGISQAAGFYRAYEADGGEVPPIVATIGDSTFFHAGIPALLNAVFQGCRFVVVILDNRTTAMTGGQPTPDSGLLADGTEGNRVPLPELVRACGVRFLEEHDPYDVEGFVKVLRRADEHRRAPDGGMAVVIARHPCVLDRRAWKPGAEAVRVTGECSGCGLCVREFECPAIRLDGEGKARVDQERCTGCAVCVAVCPFGAITAGEDAP